MDLSVHNEIYDIFCMVSNDPRYHHIWKEYSDSYHELYAWMDSLPNGERALMMRICRHFFEIHIQMMAIALREYHK